MLVTINTDASFNYQHKIGAWAFYAISNNFKIKRSGIFKNKCINPDDAEAKCIIIALSTVLRKNNDDKEITKVIVNTDSLNAIALLKNDKQHIKKYISHNQKMWKHLRMAFSEIPKHKVEIEFRVR